MNAGKLRTHKIRILVKAFPQPSAKYEETVCCAGISIDANELLRLYPIRFRRLPKSNQFTRYDLVEMSIVKDSDHRPESYHVDESSIKLLKRGKSLSDESKVKLWSPFIYPSLKELLEENKSNKRSLGIIKPDAGSIKFRIKSLDATHETDRSITNMLYQQQNSLLEEQLNPLPSPEYSFIYEFTCAGYRHTHQIHDWEVQAAYRGYIKRYGGKEEALAMLSNEYEKNIPNDNLHFIMGTMKRHPQTFILIGLLRTKIDPQDIERQHNLF